VDCRKFRSRVFKGKDSFIGSFFVDLLPFFQQFDVMFFLRYTLVIYFLSLFHYLIFLLYFFMFSTAKLLGNFGPETPGKYACSVALYVVAHAYFVS
jgi:hypothetical protein